MNIFIKLVAIYFIKCVNSGFFMTANEIKKLKSVYCKNQDHDQRTICEKNPLFGKCPSTHPFAFDSGTKCCSCELERFSLDDPYESYELLEYLSSKKCACDSVTCPDASICSDRKISK